MRRMDRYNDEDTTTKLSRSNKNKDFFGPRGFEISGYPKKVKFKKNSFKYKDDLIKKSIELTNKELK